MSHHCYRLSRWCADYPLIDTTAFFPGTRVTLKTFRGLGIIPMVSQRPAKGSVRISSTMSFSCILSSTYPARDISWQPQRCTSSVEGKMRLGEVRTVSGPTRDADFTIGPAGHGLHDSATARDTECLPFATAHVNANACLGAKDGNRVTDHCPLSRRNTRLGSLLTGLHWT